MPTPRLSSDTSEHSASPCKSHVSNEKGEEEEEEEEDPGSDVKVPIDWNTNVVNFISTCRHPGLVRRTSFGASHAPSGSYPHFKRTHRRNLSAATTVGCGGRYPETPQPYTKPSYSIFFNFYNQNNNLNSFQKPNGFRHPATFGHSRNISDPTSCWEFYRVDVKPTGAAQHLPDYPVYPLLHLSRQHSAASPERADEFSVSGDAKSQASPYLTSWQKSYPGWDDVDATAVRLPALVEPESGDQCLFPCLQPLARPKTVLFGLVCIMFVQTMVVSGLISSMLTTLERRFSFTTRQVGYIISCYEGSGVLTTAAISFVNGRKHNRLRMVGLATVLLSVGFATFAVPHFLIGPYRPNLGVPRGNASSDSLHQSDFLLCTDPVQSMTDRNPTTRSDAFIAHEKHQQQLDPVLSLSLLVFCISMILAGVGASPLHVLAPTYLWDNLDDKQYPIYSAIFYSAGGLGPACGFLAGAGFLSVYIDVPLPTPRAGLTRNDPSWLGAWWLGMLVCAILTLAAALPVIAFPARLSPEPSTSKKTAGVHLPPLDEVSLLSCG